MKKLKRIITVALAGLMVASTISLVACKPKYDCETCFDTGVIDCSCNGGTCGLCSGRGRDDSRKCNYCKGKGLVWDGENYDSLKDCSFCKGFGTHTCIFCGGDGKLEYCKECDNGLIECPDCSKN